MDENSRSLISQELIFQVDNEIFSSIKSHASLAINNSSRDLDVVGTAVNESKLPVQMQSQVEDSAVNANICEKEDSYKTHASLLEIEERRFPSKTGIILDISEEDSSEEGYVEVVQDKEEDFVKKALDGDRAETQDLFLFNEGGVTCSISQQFLRDLKLYCTNRHRPRSH